MNTIKNTEENITKDVRNLFRLKKENKVIKGRTLRDITNIFEHRDIRDIFRFKEIIK